MLVHENWRNDNEWLDKKEKRGLLSVKLAWSGDHAVAKLVARATTGTGEARWWRWRDDKTNCLCGEIRPLMFVVVRQLYPTSLGPRLGLSFARHSFNINY